MSLVTLKNRKASPTHTICYVDMDDNHQSLKQHTNLPFITFGSERVVGERDFGKEETTRELHRGASLKGMLEPTEYYPFSPSDGDGVVMQYILAALLSYLIQRGEEVPSKTVDTHMAKYIIEKSHPYHELIAKNHRRELEGRVKRIIKQCKTNKKFKTHFDSMISDRITNKNINTKALQGMNDVCTELIEFKQQQDTLF